MKIEIFLKNILNYWNFNNSLHLNLTVAAFFILFFSLNSCTSTHLFSGRINAVDLSPGNIEIPIGSTERATALIDEYGKNDLSGRVVKNLISYWAQKDIPEWNKQGAKIKAPRIILAKLIMGIDIDSVNNYLLNKAVEPWSESGSTWALRKGGDYDFTEVPLTAILYKFGNKPGLLYPETRDHLLNNLLIESGNKVRAHVPGSLNIVPDTENHILMTEGSRYLKNQYLRDVYGNTDPQYNNRTNGVETFLMDFLDELIDAGLFEFNSLPYSGYTITALMNLEAFAEEPLSSKAQEVLDTIMFKYALGSLDMRRCVPFRRQPQKAGTTSIQADDTSMLSRLWVSIDDPDFQILPITDRLHTAFYAAIMPYRVPDKTLNLIKEKDFPYFARLGRGTEASPEIFSGGPGYLLSAGGVYRGKSSMIVARPTTLILSDGITDYRDCFHLHGRGDYKDWNNTGVFRNFACSDQHVFIPEWAEPTAYSEGWYIYNLNPSLSIAAFNDAKKKDLGLLVLFPGYTENHHMLAESLSKSNPDTNRLYTEFVWPNGDIITYDVKSKNNVWVIATFNYEVLERNFDKWPDIYME
ncbi:MAG: hypothetical protein PQJ61_04115 [Spirochaetales bacterium]|uniref:Uncharacterized protein n=1 Tax=Candidatus Thalassospirochaeta sargassi TaxID=3119039 RepID=A0AAJ1MI54_9SPIO|nr:hypothetical protein [Spirochaetales bacterium]